MLISTFIFEHLIIWMFYILGILGIIGLFIIIVDCNRQKDYESCANALLGIVVMTFIMVYCTGLMFEKYGM